MKIYTACPITQGCRKSVFCNLSKMATKFEKKSRKVCHLGVRNGKTGQPSVPHLSTCDSPVHILWGI